MLKYNSKIFACFCTKLKVLFVKWDVITSINSQFLKLFPISALKESQSSTESEVNTEGSTHKQGNDKKCTMLFYILMCELYLMCCITWYKL